MYISEQMIKLDLHCHLDGSIPLDGIRSLAQIAGVEIPESKEQLKKLLQAPEDCKSLAEYLKRFELPLSCLISEESFKEAAYQVMRQAAGENVKYMELRFAPLLSATQELSARKIVESALEGIKKAEEEFEIKGNLILCAMRHMPWEKNIEVVRLVREYLGAGVCALDLAGDEAAFPVMQQKEIFQEASKYKVPFTIHAGECNSAQSVEDAISLGAERIGHGIAMIHNPELRKVCRRNRIGVEMCPVSNLQTKAVSSIQEYPFRQFWNEGVLVTVNTDNRTVSDTNIEKELNVLEKNGQLDQSQRKQLMRNSIEVSFAEDAIKEWLLKQLS